MNEQLIWRFNICIVSNAIEVVFKVVKSNKHSTVADLLEQLNTTHGDMIGRDPSLYKVSFAGSHIILLIEKTA